MEEFQAIYYLRWGVGGDYPEWEFDKHSRVARTTYPRTTQVFNGLYHLWSSREFECDET